MTQLQNSPIFYVSPTGMIHASRGSFGTVNDSRAFLGGSLDNVRIDRHSLRESPDYTHNDLVPLGEERLAGRKTITAVQFTKTKLTAIADEFEDITRVMAGDSGVVHLGSEHRRTEYLVHGSNFIQGRCELNGNTYLISIRREE
jgi:hypothetical protein